MPAAYTPPRQIQINMLGFVADVDILEGQAIAISSTTGNAVIQDALANPQLNIVGLSVNNARAGETVYVQISGFATVPRNGSAAILTGHTVGQIAGKLFDFGTTTGAFSVVGIMISQTATSQTVLVIPSFLITGAGGAGGQIVVGPNFVEMLSNPNGDILELGGGGSNTVDLKNGASNARIQFITTGEIRLTATSLTLNGSPLGASATFHDAIVPTTFNTNVDYDLPSVPNPLLSLEVFVDDTTLGVNGLNKLMQQGVDYTLTNGNSRIHFIGGLTINKIVCWYRS